MNIPVVVDVVIGLSLTTFVLLAISSLSRITSTRFIGMLALLAVFFLTMWVSTFIDGHTLKIGPLLLFVWLWCFAFYYFGLRYISGRGVLGKMPFTTSTDIASQSHSSPRLVEVLQWWRHLLIWPI